MGEKSVHGTIFIRTVVIKEREKGREGKGIRRAKKAEDERNRKQVGQVQTISLEGHMT